MQASMIYLDYSRKEGEWMPGRDSSSHESWKPSGLKKLNVQAASRCPVCGQMAEESTAFTGVSPPRPLLFGRLGSA